MPLVAETATEVARMARYELVPVEVKCNTCGKTMLRVNTGRHDCRWYRCPKGCVQADGAQLHKEPRQYIQRGS